MTYKQWTFSLSLFFTLMLGIVLNPVASAAQLTLSWNDNSTNENGFYIERRVGTSGTYQQIASTGANSTSYTDPNLANSTTYCYRVRAFNSAGSSTYSNENCVTTPATTFTVTVNRSGTGSGTVTSSPAGIICGSDCTENYLSSTPVTLTAVAAAGSTFAGWSGNADCTDGSVTVSAGMNCTATFNLATYALSVNKTGTGSGTVTSSPAGIICGSDCTENYLSGTPVALTAVTAAGSTFAGWSGNADCTDGSVTVNAGMNCTATFNLATYALSVNKTGTGSGTVTSSPAGITCGNDCTENYASGTPVTLTAVAAAGSTFAGWSGSAGCSNGNFTVNGNINCTAMFNLNLSGYTLSTSVANQVTSAGSASGRVVSNPAGIDCGTDCTEVYSSGKTVVLTPVPASNSKFTNWTGSADCSDGSVTMDANKNCTANFALSLVTLSIKTTGNGAVTGTPSAINCSTACSYSFVPGTSLSLRATAASGYSFSGWSGAGCTGTADCNFILSASMTATANFFSELTEKIGVYRPSTGEWFLDRNGNGRWDDGFDLRFQSFAGTDGQPVAGDWKGTGKTKIGLFVAESSQWLLDVNGNGTWDGCGADVCVQSFGQSTDVPFTGDWTAAGYDWIAVFRPKEGKWYLDYDGDGRLESCRRDKCQQLGNYSSGDLPVSGDWTGRRTTQFGLFRPRTGEWFLDGNANGRWNNCTKDICATAFGTLGDIPVSGDWKGTGVSHIGVFRPSTGEWLLDGNGNGKWDGPTQDLHIPSFGKAGDIPVIGRW